jgi:cysteinyl-tRNA synthetase
LSHRNVDDLRSGVRIELGEAKKDPLDFALWKTAKPGEPTWASPWGAGRPGWHIECSAMTTAVLGQPFDIHGGGLDLKFPHHENEIAQSESACHEGFAHYWMHVGLLQINKEKMSKSLGNFVTIQQALTKHHPELIRYFMLSSHYRSPVNYSDDHLIQMHQALSRFYAAIDALPEVTPEFSHYQEQFNAAMDDDFNTPQALAVLFEMAREINRLKESGDQGKAAALASGLKQLADPLGLLKSDPAIFLIGDTTDLDTVHIEQLIAQRQQARLEKNWARADAVRDELLTLGIELLDTKEGVKWRRR